MFKELSNSKKSWKYVNNWQSYRMQCNVLLFGTTLYSICLQWNSSAGPTESNGMQSTVYRRAPAGWLTVHDVISSQPYSGQVSGKHSLEACYLVSANTLVSFRRSLFIYSSIIHTVNPLCNPHFKSHLHDVMCYRLVIWVQLNRTVPVVWSPYLLYLSEARFPFKRNRLRCVRCVNENRKKRKRLTWQ